MESARRGVVESADIDLDAIAKVVDEFDPEEAKRKNRDEDEPYTCASCGETTSLRPEHEPAPLCDSCTHQALIVFSCAYINTRDELKAAHALIADARREAARAEADRDRLSTELEEMRAQVRRAFG